MHVLFAPLQPFVWHPERIAAVAGILALAAVVLFFTRRRAAWPISIAAAMWALFAVWEWQCKVERADIRVDLLLIGPVLLVLTVGGVIDALISAFGGKHQDRLRNLVIAVMVIALLLVLIARLM